MLTRPNLPRTGRPVLSRALVQSTGIAVSDEVISLFNDFKLKRTEHRFIVMQIVGEEVVKTATVGKDTSTEDFLTSQLGGELANTPAFIAIDFDYKTNDDRDADKIILLTWIPVREAGSEERVSTIHVARAPSHRSPFTPSLHRSRPVSSVVGQSFVSRVLSLTTRPLTSRVTRMRLILVVDNRIRRRSARRCRTRAPRSR